MSRGKLALVLLVSGLIGGMGSAAAPCSTASLSAYQSIGAVGCSVGSLTFSDFLVDAFPGPTATQIAPESILVTPLADGFSLSSAATLSALSGDLLGLRFLFEVSAPSLTGATVALGGENGVSGDGVITALLDAGSAGSTIAIIIDGLSDTPTSFASPSRASYDAFFELGIDGGTLGSASLSSTLASVTFNSVAVIPEPSTVALSLLGLMALMARRHWRAAQV